ncbi:MAG: hypothetical protein ACKO96_17580, partial [Flammeovirgaceae bacterium]
IFLLLVGMAIATPLFIYYRHFGSGNVSQSPERWGQFGDYVGGILNPIISLINLYLLYSIFKHQTSENQNAIEQEKLRHQEGLRYSIIPWGDFHLSLADMIQISFKNHGNGPMIVTGILFTKNGQSLNSPANLVPDGLNRIRMVTLPTNDTMAISKGEEIILFELFHPELSTRVDIQSLFDTWLNELSQVEIEVQYKDILDNPTNPTSKKCNLRQWSEAEAKFTSRYKAKL